MLVMYHPGIIFLHQGQLDITRCYQVLINMTDLTSSTSTQHDASFKT